MARVFGRKTTWTALSLPPLFSFNRRSRISFLSVAAILLWMALTLTSVVSVYSGDLPVAGRPLAELVGPDGTLDLGSGFRGPIDPRGWSLISGPEEVPRFAPADPLFEVPDDRNWAGIFNCNGLTGSVSALTVDGSGRLYAGG